MKDSAPEMGNDGHGSDRLMTQLPDTRESLLIRLGNPSDVAAWAEFVSIYRPMIYRLARRQGLQDSDAEDLAQRVLMSVSRVIGDWRKDAARGTFRGWLSRVARNAMINMMSRRPKEAALGGSDFFVACQTVVAPSKEVELLIRQEHQRSLLRAAAERVKAKMQATTWQAFWRTTIGGQSIEETSRELDISVGAVYGARARVMKQLQIVADSMTAEEILGE
jgi:RNA polymerase sigma-70 factor (ECF subfamily)